MPRNGERDDPIAVRQIPSVVTVVDMATGERTEKPGAWTVLPPPENACQICGRRHPPDDPHDAQQIYYKTTFHSQIGRLPTWADAMAHCAPELRARWEARLREVGRWTEPPNGERPVKHHGIEPDRPDTGCGNG